MVLATERDLRPKQAAADPSMTFSEYFEKYTLDQNNYGNFRHMQPLDVAGSVFSSLSLSELSSFSLRGQTFKDNEHVVTKDITITQIKYTMTVRSVFGMDCVFRKQDSSYTPTLEAADVVGRAVITSSSTLFSTADIVSLCMAT